MYRYSACMRVTKTASTSRFAKAARQVWPITATVATAPYVDPNGIYDRPTILKARAAGSALDFDFFFMKSGLGSPVVMHSDGQVRWTMPGLTSSVATVLTDNGFLTGDTTRGQMRRLELDGTMTTFPLNAAGVTDFHHNIDAGKQGVLVELDVQRPDGVPIVESTLAEVDPATGTVYKRWDVGDTLSRYMTGQGDDPTNFVRPGVDWFHMNSAIYDPRDDTLMISSRENFVMKIDYASGDLIWILGDPTKYWHDFASLAAKALTLATGDLYPIGQHSLSITHDGLLLLFNDGDPSFNQPTGAPPGQTRPFSTVSAYSIDAPHGTAHEAWRFDYGQTIDSGICSSAYQASIGDSILASYAVADAGTHARLVGLGANRSVVFDFQFTTSGCNTSWNAAPIPFEAMQFLH